MTTLPAPAHGPSAGGEPADDRGAAEDGVIPAGHRATGARGRFHPTRAGIINLWDYRDDEFVFADGRLVLRGPNGSGKTKALEVLFPFVLDGRIEPRRLNPFASEERTMRSNLLYRGQDTAYAYVWMEFGRGAEFVTIGIGLRATRQRDRVDRWYFVADGRVGVDFALLSADDRPLSKRDLADQLPADAIVDRSVEHRAAVDERLFGLGAERYEQLLRLVLTLRRPQLAKNLDPKGLSQALTEGLRPLDADLITEAARSFGDMESVQQTLANLVAADGAVQGFLADYLTYLRTHARAAADRVGGRLDETMTAGRRLAAALTERDEADGALAGADGEQRAAAAELSRGQGRLESLRASSAYQDREQLNQQALLVAELAATAEQAATRAAAAEQESDRRRGQLTGAADAVERARADLAHIAHTVERAAADAGIAWSSADGDADDLRTRASARAEERADDLAAVRRASAQVDAARAERDRAQRALDRAEQQLLAAQDLLDSAETALTDEQRRLGEAVDSWTEQHRATLELLDSDGLGTAGAPDAAAATGADRVRAELAGLIDTIGTGSARTLPERFDGLAKPTTDHAAATIVRLGEQASRLADEIAGLRARRDTIAAERDDAPPAFAARTADRSALPGAPLWRLVRFADGVSDEDAAGIEASLHAANMLDAWVPADPEAAVPDADTVLVALPAEARPDGRTLADVLRPDDPVDVAAGQVAAILASIRLESISTPTRGRPTGTETTDIETTGTGLTSTEPGAGDTGPRNLLMPLTSAAPTVTPSGWFRAGLQTGSHHAPTVQYIGATARARRRAQRLAELDAEIAAAEQAAATLTDRLERTRAELDDLARARAALPAADGIVAARREVDRAAGQLAAARSTETDTRRIADEAVATLAGAQTGLHRVAVERNLPDERGPLDAVGAALDAFRGAVPELVAARRTAIDRQQAHEAATAEVSAADSAARERRAESDRAADDQQRRQAELDTLREAIGATAEQVEADIAEARDEIAAATERSEAAGQQLEQAAGRAGAARPDCTAAAERLTRAVVEVQRDAVGLRPFAATDLREVLGIDAELNWPSTAQAWPEPAATVAAVGEALRRSATTGSAAEQESPDTASYVIETLPAPVRQLYDAIMVATADLRPTESSLKSSSTRMSAALAELQTRLSAAGHDYRPEWNDRDGIVVVQVADEDGYTPIGTFAARIAADRQDQEQLLTESERRILADAILGRLAQQIHTRTLGARDLIGRMSDEMKGRRMSSGAAIGIKWDKADDLDDEGRAVSTLLERDAARLDSDDFARLRAYFASRIKDLRAARPDRSYPDILAEALDYRRWRSFQLTLITPDGTVERLTRARHSTLSGGEQSVSLHLPLFAAAHVMLGSARTGSPRLAAMDEAFAGIDDSGRGELLGLTVDFDLDLFMTGHDLWATYASVPGCAHYDLAHVPMEHAVSSLLMVWDGGELLADTSATDLAAALGSPGTRRVSAAPEWVLTDAAGNETS